MINAAIVGLGWWGKGLVQAVQGKSTAIRFVHGVTQEIDATRDFAAAQGLPLSDNLDAALADPRVEAVVLATPHSLHADQICAAAAAGKHVFCEKPLALTGADARRAVAAVKAANRVLAVGQNKRFWPSMRALNEVVNCGKLGMLMHLEAHYSNEHSSKHFAGWRDLPAETPGAGMTGTGIHLLDAFVGIAGAVSQVTTQMCSMRAGHDPRDTVSVMLRFANGMSGFLGCVRATPIYWRVHVFGDEGSAEALGETTLVLRQKNGRTDQSTYAPVDSVRAELEAFAAAVAGHASGTSPYPISTAQMAQTIAALEAIFISLETGKPVALEAA